jgi:MerR family transcriptional regulator, light-induced transcriptional regulator
MPSGPSVISIGELASATGVAPGTLRMWEARHGFPAPTRQASGDRRYRPDDIARVARVLHERERGLSLAAAIERVRHWSPGAPVSLFSTLREHQPELHPRRLPRTAMLALSHAIEDECLARAARPLLAAGFQHERHYRRAEHRWRELARSAELAFVLADFPRRNAPPDGPDEIPLAPHSPVIREWAVVCVDEHYTACLAGWEEPNDRGQRSFEAVWSTEPNAVVATLRGAVALGAGDIGDRADEFLDRLPVVTGGGTTATLALANRMIGYLADAAATG